MEHEVPREQERLPRKPLFQSNCLSNLRERAKTATEPRIPAAFPWLKEPAKGTTET
jgi:hypothetical protein